MTVDAVGQDAIPRGGVGSLAGDQPVERGLRIQLQGVHASTHLQTC